MEIEGAELLQSLDLILSQKDSNISSSSKGARVPLQSFSLEDPMKQLSESRRYIFSQDGNSISLPMKEG